MRMVKTTRKKMGVMVLSNELESKLKDLETRQKE